MVASSTMESVVYSVRMRAADDQQHLSGAERLVDKAEVEETVSALTLRALRAADVSDVEIHCSVEKINSDAIQFMTLPNVQPYQVASYEEGRDLAESLLEVAGVPKQFARDSLKTLDAGPGPGGQVMRGAVVVDVCTGERLEDDPARGVRATRMDLTAECRVTQEALLLKADLGHRRVIEALTLSGKVLSAPGVVAELCWSDDSAYTAGYVASPSNGYQRISDLKASGNPIGGRVIFVDLSITGVVETVDFLENQPILFNQPGEVFSCVKWSPDHV